MGERIRIESNGGTDACLARPAKPGPGIVVIQEYWGLVPHIEHIADRFAAEGFVALAPDLFHGQQAKSPDQAGKLMMSMRIDQAARDIDAAVERLGKTPELKGKIGVIGFCMGGALSLYAASRNPEIGACVVFYGGHPNVNPDLASLHSAVLGIFGGRDNFVTPDVVKELDRQLTAFGKPHEFHTYPQAQHAFFNDARPEVHDPQASADAWKKTLAFLRRELT